MNYVEVFVISNDNGNLLELLKYQCEFMPSLSKFLSDSA